MIEPMIEMLMKEGYSYEEAERIWLDSLTPEDLQPEWEPITDCEPSFYLV